MPSLITYMPPEAFYFERKRVHHLVYLPEEKRLETALGCCVEEPEEVLRRCYSGHLICSYKSVPISPDGCGLVINDAEGRLIQGASATGRLESIDLGIARISGARVPFLERTADAIIGLIAQEYHDFLGGNGRIRHAAEWAEFARACTGIESLTGESLHEILKK